MNETLEFPDIEVQALEPGAIVEIQPSRKIDLASIDLTDVALAGFGDWKTEVAQVKAKLTGLVLDMPTQAKVDEFKSLRQSLINSPIAEARKTSKAIKSKMAKTSKAVGEAEEQIVAAYEEAATLITPAIDKRQAELDAERARKAAGQAFRAALHMALIDRINGYVDAAHGLASDRITKGVEFVESLTFGAECEEFKPQYEAAQQNTLATLRKMLADTQAAEAAEAQRLENERVAAELAEQRRALEEQAAALARQKAEQDAAELQRQVQATHAFVFAFPAPEPVAAPAIAQAPVPSASLVAANNAARAEIAASAEPVAPVAQPAQEEATVRLGEICARVGQGFTMTAAFVEQTLGVKPAAIDKAARLYTPTQERRIYAALINHLQGLQMAQAA